MKTTEKMHTTQQQIIQEEDEETDKTNLGKKVREWTESVTQALTIEPDKPDIHCRVHSGSALFAPRQWKPFQNKTFVLPVNERVDVKLSARKGQGEMTFLAYANMDHQKMTFCPYAEGPPDKRIACKNIYVLGPDFEGGIKRTFDIPKAVRGGILSCALDPADMK